MNPGNRASKNQDFAGGFGFAFASDLTDDLCLLYILVRLGTACWDVQQRSTQSDC